MQLTIDRLLNSYEIDSETLTSNEIDIYEDEHLWYFMLHANTKPDTGDCELVATVREGNLRSGNVTVNFNDLLKTLKRLKTDSEDRKTDPSIPSVQRLRIGNNTLLLANIKHNTAELKSIPPKPTHP